MIVKTLAELPDKYTCKMCGAEKLIAEMVLVRLRKREEFLLRPRCKACHNAREKGHRREYKRNYLRRWRKWNHELNESYWRSRNQEKRLEINANHYLRFQRDHAAILIQGRLRRRLQMHVSIEEARELAKKFGPCYPTRFGLTPEGRRECERIRSRMRAAGRRISPVEIRMMVYEDGYYITPLRQPKPFRIAAARLRRWHQEQKNSRPDVARPLAFCLGLAEIVQPPESGQREDAKGK